MARHHGPSQRVCVVGDIQDLGDIERLLAQLADDAYGQMLLTAPPTSGIPALTAGPSRVSVTWLRSDPCNTAAKLRGAVAAWLAEWLPDQSLADPRPMLWIGRQAARLLSGGSDLIPLDGFASIPSAVTLANQDAEVLAGSTGDE